MDYPKYVVTKYDEEPILFSAGKSHDDICTKENVLSAGFWTVNNEGKFVCFGESVSLGVKSRGDEDSFLLNRRFGLIEFDPWGGRE